MDKNFDLYCSSLLMLRASEHLHKHDPDFSNYLLEKATKYIQLIKIDQKLIDEVNKYASEIEESVKEDIR